MIFHSNRSLIHLQNELFDGTGCISSLLNVARGNTRPLDLYLTETKASDGVQQNLGFLHVCKSFSQIKSSTVPITIPETK